MSQLDYLGEFPHLPIGEGTTLIEAIEMCNTFYQTHLDPNDYRQTQAYMSPEGRLQIDIISVVNDEVLTTFMNRSAEYTGELRSSTYSTKTLLNPLMGEIDRLGPPLKLRHVNEMDFLNNYPVNERTDFITANYEAARFLADLLNSYQFVGRWVAGSMGGFSTAGFVLLQKDSNQAIIEITHGDNKGTLCLIG